MRRARADARLLGRIAEAEALWYDRARWAAWVDGFAAIRSTEGDWPQVGASVVWDSYPGGRGRVIERVTSYEPRRGQVVAVEDEQLRGERTLAFEALGEDGFDMRLELAYTLKKGGPLIALTDLFFIRRALRDSLRREVDRFAIELAAERELPGSGG